MIRKPMLASKIKDIKSLKYPFFVSPKFDGIRALTINGMLVSRNFKPIPNIHTRSLARNLPNNLDGELVLANGTIAGATFSETSSAVMKEEGTPDVRYHVFDYVLSRLDTPFYQRSADLAFVVTGMPAKGKSFVMFVDHQTINSEAELLKYEQGCVENGYEGVMIRGIYSPYKEGRSTEKEGYLLKLKIADDSEAIVFGFEEKMHNTNEAEEDAFGRTKRSHKKEGLIPANTLGNLVVRDLYTDIEFEVGTGFNDKQRQEIWDNQSRYLSNIIKYKYQARGMKEKPRFPVFLGFRDTKDL